MTTGSAIYRDRYRRIDNEWKTASTEFDRIMEVHEPIRPDMKIIAHYHAKVGRKPEARVDVSDFVIFPNVAG